MLVVCLASQQALFARLVQECSALPHPFPPLQPLPAECRMQHCLPRPPPYSPGPPATFPVILACAAGCGVLPRPFPTAAAPAS